VTDTPLKIAESALTHAKRYGFDVLLVDTAGRLHVDEAMMSEIKSVHAAVQPIETLFVIDCMAGQDAVTVAKSFDQALPLTGVIITKADGDARGGVALSVRHVTGKPIKFMGVGEKTSALQAFHPDRVASRILGMGDVFSLIEDLEQTVDKKKADQMIGKLKKGGFDLSDFAEQLEQVEKMGGMGKIADKIPGFSGLSEQAKKMSEDKTTLRSLAIIRSMTLKERQMPDLINGSRRRRIAAGSGTQIQDVNRLLKQFEQIQKAMKQMGKKGGMMNLMRQMQSRMPPGMMK
jgi:signal recognition particle subunit SRP54